VTPWLTTMATMSYPRIKIHFPVPMGESCRVLRAATRSLR